MIFRNLQTQTIVWEKVLARFFHSWTLHGASGFYLRAAICTHSMKIGTTSDNFGWKWRLENVLPIIFFCYRRTQRRRARALIFHNHYRYWLNLWAILLSIFLPILFKLFFVMNFQNSCTNRLRVKIIFFNLFCLFFILSIYWPYICWLSPLFSHFVFRSIATDHSNFRFVRIMGHLIPFVTRNCLEVGSAKNLFAFLLLYGVPWRFMGIFRTVVGDLS